MMEITSDYYARLGLPRDATAEEIRRADYDLASPAEADEQPAHLSALYSCSVAPLLDEPQLIYVLLALTPPTGHRAEPSPPLNVCLVLDRSTSMQGKRMDTVKAAAVELTRQLRDRDTLSIVIFGDRAEVLLPASDRRERKRMEAAIHLLRAGGATEIYHGLEGGLNEVRRNLRAASINHLVLLTDGHTYGDEEACLHLAEQAAIQGIGITALGIGSEWNDAFLDNLASRTGGSSMYVSRPGDIEHLLKQKFHKLGQLYAERVRLEMDSGKEASLRSLFRLEPEVGNLPIKAPIYLGGIPAEGSLSVLMEFYIEPISPRQRRIPLAEGRIILDIPARQPPTAMMRLSLGRPIGNLLDPEKPPATIMQAMARLTLYRMQEKARQDAASGDIPEATRRLEHLATRLLAQGRRDLARTVLVEAENLQNSRAFSSEGEKRIKYGTRALLLSAHSEATPL